MVVRDGDGADMRSMLMTLQIDMESSLLGEGEFGEVRKGMWRKRNGTTVEVAVKVGAHECARARVCVCAFRRRTTNRQTERGHWCILKM